MPEAVRRRGRRGGDAIYFDHRGQCRDPEHHRHCPGRWLSAVSRIENGKRVRRKVSGRTKSAVKDKLKALHDELDQGVKPAASYHPRSLLPSGSWIQISIKPHGSFGGRRMTGTPAAASRACSAYISRTWT